MPNRRSVCCARIRVNTSMFDEVASRRRIARRYSGELKDCRRCKLAPGRTNLVFGSGNPRMPSSCLSAKRLEQTKMRRACLLSAAPVSC